MKLHEYNQRSTRRVRIITVTHRELELRRLMRVVLAQVRAEREQTENDEASDED